MSFSTFPGQPAAVSFLKSALEGGRLPHALLFAGPAEAGQRELAVELAKALFCPAAKGAQCCDACASCRRTAQYGHPDLLMLEPEEDTRVIKVEAVRALKARAALKPFEATSKVFIIDPADGMNDIAQNALLKTLEEPEGRTLIILISSSPERLLATLRSRAQTLNFLPVARDRQVPEETQAFQTEALRYALGEAARPPDLTRLEREEIAGVLEDLIEYHREALLIRVDASGLLQSDADRFGKEGLARACDEEELSRRIETLAEFKERISETANIKLALAVLWDSLREGKKV